MLLQQDHHFRLIPLAPCRRVERGIQRTRRLMISFPPGKPGFQTLALRLRLWYLSLRQLHPLSAAQPDRQ